MFSVSIYAKREKHDFYIFSKDFEKIESFILFHNEIYEKNENITAVSACKMGT
jgi:hypothetical protein